MDAIVADNIALPASDVSAPGRPVLQAWHVWKVVRSGDTERHVLSNCSLSVEAGALVAIHGEPSHGRTELMSVLAGFDAPTRGVVLYEGDPLIDPMGGPETASRRRHIGYLFATSMLLPTLSARENTQLVLRGLHLPDLTPSQLQRSVDEALQLSGFSGAPDRPVGTLDRLQRVRAALATSLVKNPTVLLCEAAADAFPTGDAMAILETFDRLRHERRMAIVHATARLEFAQRATHSYRLRNGRLEPLRAVP